MKHNLLKFWFSSILLIGAVTGDFFLAKDSSAEPLQPSALPSKVSIFTGQGFNRCELADLGILQNWKESSPFGVMTLWMGGVSRQCNNSQLSADAVTSLHNMGWKFVPIWSGPQAPCSTFASKMSSDLVTAEAEGRAEADLAIAEAIRLGIANPDSSGTVIYYRVEDHPDDAGCREAVKSFISGWSARLRELGNLAGVYGHRCNGFVFYDFPNLTHAPDALFYTALANTYTEYYPSISVFGPLAVTTCGQSDAVWVDSRRMREYTTAEHSETYGAETLNITNISVQAPVADLDGKMICPDDMVCVPNVISPTPNSTCEIGWYPVGGYNGFPSYLTLNAMTNESSTVGNRAEWYKPLAAGSYEIELYIPGRPMIVTCHTKSIDDTSNATYVVEDRLGSHTVAVDQAPEANSWASLGVYQCDEGIHCKVKLSDGTGEASHTTFINFSAVRFVLQRPNPPTELNASDRTYDNIALIWQPSESATHYTIYRGTTIDGADRTEIGRTTSTSFSDTTASLYTLYYYWVTAENDAGISDFSNSDPGQSIELGDFTVLAIYALAMDNNPLDSSNLSSNINPTIDSLIEATLAHPGKAALVLADGNRADDTEIYLIINGEVNPITGLPNLNGVRDIDLREYDMTDGATLGGFLRWALQEYGKADPTVVFTFVGHGGYLIPDIDISQIYTQTSRAISPIFPLPHDTNANPSFTDEHPAQKLITPYALALALKTATADGADPIDVVDLAHCSSGTIEEVYELKDFTKAIVASPNYAYFTPKMAGDGLKQMAWTDTPFDMAKKLVDSHDAMISSAEDDGIVAHPRVYTAIQTDALLDIKLAFENLAAQLLFAFNDNPTQTTNKLLQAYQKSGTWYDTTQCTSSWKLDSEDDLVDIFYFMEALSNEFGATSGIGSAAKQIQNSFYGKVYTVNRDGTPWFSSSKTPWQFGDESFGLALYAPLSGVTDGITGTTRLLSWQTRFYTTTTTITDPDDNPHPFEFIRPSALGINTWADLISRYWQTRIDQGEIDKIETARCLLDLSPVRQSAEVWISELPLPYSATSYIGAATAVGVSINADRTINNLRVLLEVVSNNDNTVVFSDTVGIDQLVPGLQYIESNQLWTPNSAGNYSVRATVDPDNRIKETDEANTFTKTIFVQDGTPYIFTATIAPENQFISSLTVPIELDSAVSPTELCFQIYQYRHTDTTGLIQRSDPFPLICKKEFPDFPTYHLELPIDLAAGIVLVDVWGYDGDGNVSSSPRRLSFNYNPDSNPIGQSEGSYRFWANSGETRIINFELISGTVELYLFFPGHHRTAEKLTESGSIPISSTREGEYLILVSGMDAAANYRLTVDNSVQARQSWATSATMVQKKRPIAVAPVPQLIKVVPTAIALQENSAENSSVFVVLGALVMLLLLTFANRHRLFQHR